MVACCWLVDWKVNCQAECHQSNTSANILHTSPLTVYSLVILHTDFVSTGAHLAFQLINNKSQHVPSLFPSDHRSPINMILSDLKTNCFFFGSRFCLTLWGFGIFNIIWFRYASWFVSTFTFSKYFFNSSMGKWPTQVACQNEFAKS